MKRTIQMKAVPSPSSKRGQAMLEYLMVIVVSFGLIIMTALLYHVFREHGGRILDLAASEYP